ADLVTTATTEAPTTTVTTPAGTTAEEGEEPFDFGDDPVLDGLWNECEAADFAACDALFLQSPSGSEYALFSASCGGRTEPYGSCVDLYGAADCSASELAADPSDQAGLPEPVAEIRRLIVAAAVACDYEALASLALAGDEPFIFSFGDGDDPAAFWRDAEALGAEDLRFLVELLDRPFTFALGDYVWPSASVYEDWASVPEADREALKPLYDEEDFLFFEEAEGYIGSRVGITEEGDWIFFVVGD
ncbi:MAG: hypothetical protein ACE5KX_00800, partial [Acidimicrobiia bacterium]